MLHSERIRECLDVSECIFPKSWDIDVWVNASREQITEYAKKHFMIGDDIRYHHLETTLDGVPMELHFFPGIMNNPIYNARLQKWFKRNADLQCSNVV